MSKSTLASTFHLAATAPRLLSSAFWTAVGAGASDVQTRESKINIEFTNVYQTYLSFVRMMLYGGD